MSERLDELQRRFDAALDDDNEDPLSLGELHELCCLQGDEIDRLRDQLKAVATGEWDRICRERDEAREAAKFLNQFTSGWEVQWPWLREVSDE